jgi:hypothetical protein
MFAPSTTPFVGLVSRPKLTGAGRHAGVMLPDGQVAHMTPGGAAVVSFEEFAQGHEVKAEKAAPRSSHWQLQWRAHQSVGRTPTYDLLNRNCEHYATWLIGDEPQSPQVNGAVVLGLLGTVLWLAK